MITFKEYLKESLLHHIALELKELDPIYEKYGEYDGCNELASYIENRCKDNENVNNIIIKYDEVKHIDNVVFDSLEIEIIKDNNVNASYVADSTKGIDENTKRFKYCKIVLYFDDIFSLNKIHSIIEHELMHLFTDYKLQQSGLKSFLDIFKNDEVYKKSREFIKRKPLEQREINRALYMFNEYEKNAFMAQLMDEINELKKSYSDNSIDATKMYHMVQSLDIYKAYMQIGDFIRRYDNDNLTRREKENIVIEWENVFNKTESLDSIFKQLKRKFIKTKNKIESLIPKKIAESVGYYGIDSKINLDRIVSL